MKDYIILKDYNGGWYEIFYFDHELTNGDIERIQDLIQHIKNTVEDYSNEDIEEQLDELIPYTKNIIISDDDYHTIYF